MTARTRRDPTVVSRWPGVHDVDIRDGQIRFTVGRDVLDPTMVHLTQLGIADLTVTPASLEDLFLREYRTPATMIATATAPASSSLTGTVTLVRFALRRDRIRLAVWVSVLTLMMVYAPNAIKLAYPDEAQRQARVNLLKTPAGIMLGGPMFGGNETDLGVMMANELTLTLIVAASILAIQTVVRHTRAEEESGAAELVLSSIVGRHARTGAALIVVVLVNAVLAMTMTIAMAATGFAVADTAAMCLGITAVATVFGALAALSAQLWRQARTAPVRRWRRWPPPYWCAGPAM